MTEHEHPAVTNFREYIRIKTVQPNPDYATSTEFLKRQGRELGAKVHVMECAPGKPIVIMTVDGQDPTLPSLLLNSHTDVVPVFPEHWKYDPFSAHKDEEGYIHGRGTQDMKSVGIQYLEALKQLKKDGKTFLRTIHLTFVPDEEIDSKDGTQALVKTDYFKKMNIGFALDEGYSSTSEDFLVFYGERQAWHVYVRCNGQPGHGSQFLPNTAGEKLCKVINSFLSFRDKEERRLKDNPNVSLGHVTTLNLTMLEGGVQFNVVPTQLSVGFDIRCSPMVDVIELEDMLQGWCRDAGEDVVLDIIDRTTPTTMTCVEEGRVLGGMPFLKPARRTLGFSAMNNTPRLLHDHNECLSEEVFLRGIQIYASIISALASVKA